LIPSPHAKPPYSWAEMGWELFEISFILLVFIPMIREKEEIFK